jgi:hypothetical protein
MKRAILLGLLIGSAAGAQPPTPSEPGLDLARLLMQRDETLYDDADGGRLVGQLREALLATPGGCNPFLADCRAAAEAVARRYAPDFRTAERARAEAIMARWIAARMSGEEAARVAALLRSADGERLLALLGALRAPREIERRRRELARGDVDINRPLAEARRVFANDTRGIPRAPPR